MPEINRPKRKKTFQKHGKSLDISRIYNSSRWMKLRNGYFLLHPLCERCLEKEIVKPTEEIHHIKPISSGGNELEMESLAYDPGNLIALCKECHREIHKEMKNNANQQSDFKKTKTEEGG